MNKAKRVLKKNDDGTYGLLKLDSEEKNKEFDKIKNNFKYSNVYDVVDELVVSHNDLIKKVDKQEKMLAEHDKAIRDILDKLTEHDERLEEVDHIKKEWEKHLIWIRKNK